MQYLKKLIRKIVVLLSKPTIVFESFPDFSDNTYAVYREMVARKLQKKYQFVWLNKDGVYVQIKERKGKTHVHRISHVGRFKTVSIAYKTRAVICCNRYTNSSTKDAKIFYLTHGTPIKKTYYPCPSYVDYFICQGEKIKDVYVNEFNVPSSKIISLGFPRNDSLLKPQRDVRRILKTKCNKVLVWFPTFRQHFASDTLYSSPALPIIHDTKKAQILNDTLRALNVLIVLKPHFSQDTSYIQQLNLSNICFIDDSFFSKNDILTYEFVAGCDALLTDYSSIYFDYLLCDKPIGAVWEDFEIYCRSPGFSLDVNYYMKGAHKIYSLEDLIRFVHMVVGGTDNLRHEREEIRALIAYDGNKNSATMVTDFILSHFFDCG